MLFTKVREVKSPSRGTSESAGFDFYVPADVSPFTIFPGQSVNIPSGIKLVIEPGHAGIFFNKSSVGSKGVLAGACVVDQDYRGEVHLNVHNVSSLPVEYKPGQKLIQMLVIPVSVLTAVELTEDEYFEHSNTARGSGGFGSTGV